LMPDSSRSCRTSSLNGLSGEMISAIDSSLVHPSRATTGVHQHCEDCQTTNIQETDLFAVSVTGIPQCATEPDRIRMHLLSKWYKLIRVAACRRQYQVDAVANRDSIRRF
jgi:hypothetical protein